MGDIADVGIGVVGGKSCGKILQQEKEEGMCRTCLESSESVGKKSGVEGRRPQTHTSRF